MTLPSPGEKASDRPYGPTRGTWGDHSPAAQRIITDNGGTARGTQVTVVHSHTWPSESEDGPDTTSAARGQTIVRSRWSSGGVSYTLEERFIERRGREAPGNSWVQTESFTDPNTGLQHTIVTYYDEAGSNARRIDYAVWRNGRVVNAGTSRDGGQSWTAQDADTNPNGVLNPANPGSRGHGGSSGASSSHEMAHKDSGNEISSNTGNRDSSGNTSSSSGSSDNKNDSDSDGGSETSDSNNDNGDSSPSSDNSNKPDDPEKPDKGDSQPGDGTMTARNYFAERGMADPNAPREKNTNGPRSPLVNPVDPPGVVIDTTQDRRTPGEIADMVTNPDGAQPATGGGSKPRGPLVQPAQGGEGAGGGSLPAEVAPGRPDDSAGGGIIDPSDPAEATR